MTSKYTYYTCSWNNNLSLFADDIQICKDLLASSPEESSEAFSKVMCYFKDSEYDDILQKYPTKTFGTITLALITCYTAVTEKSITDRRYHDSATLTDKFKIWTVINSQDFENIFKNEEEKRKILRYNRS